ncbi:MAG: ribosome biogenesis GTPase YlqF [Lachnospiraceae bacterium]|nr:ribosome biogenesis GTPase YlqF [Lachnospiraceae bacterium]
MADIQWFPGHMTKALREMENNIKLVDMVIELRDARLPLSSANPELSKLGKGKLRLVLLNKADLADIKDTEAWKAYFTKQGVECVALDSRNTSSKKLINNAVTKLSKEKKERDLKRGIKNRPVRAMVAGIPNAGKSTFINMFAGKSSAKTGDKPGVTKGTQWIRLSKELELLDTPGVLWPKFEDEDTAYRLAMTGAIKRDNLDMELLAIKAIDILKNKYPGRLSERYGIEEDGASLSLLKAIAVKRGALKKGGEEDTLKASELLYDELRTGKLGRLTLEIPE